MHNVSLVHAITESRTFHTSYAFNDKHGHTHAIRGQGRDEQIKAYNLSLNALEKAIALECTCGNSLQKGVEINITEA